MFVKRESIPKWYVLFEFAYISIDGECECGKSVKMIWIHHSFCE